MIEEYSNPTQVFKNAKELFGENVKIKLSTRKDKKYMMFDPILQQWTHFGEMGYEDFTKHRDNKRRMNFLKRNHEWSKAYIYSPAFLSFHLLW